MDEGNSSWLRRFHPAPEDAPQLLWFPHAGGSASSYFSFSAELSSSLEMIVVQYPGRADRRREPVIENLVGLAEQIVGQVRTLPGDRPLAIFGHSMGAAVAFEVARRLDPSPVAFFASGRRAPSRVRQENVHRLSDEEFLTEVRRLDGTDTRLLDNPRLLKAILPMLRGDYIAIGDYRYRPGPPLSCPVTVLTGDADPLTTVDEASCWREHTTGEFGMQVFPGGHFFINEHRAEIAAIVLDRLTPSRRTRNKR
jgi:pyochelin biosynthetic protein PchC